MPAATAPDLLALPRVAAPAATSRPRPVRSVTTAPRGFEGEGFPVRRAFHGVELRDLDPFVHLDQMGEVQYAPGEPKGTPWHPHRGFETVTYMIDGQMVHADTHGGGGVIGGGDTQWMTAGSGLLHIETPPESLVVSGGLFHGFQLWVNLPRAQKMVDPRYQDIRGGEVRLLTTPDGGALLRLIAGDLGDHVGPGSTRTPIVMVHATIAPGAEVRLPWRADFNALAYVLNGRGEAGDARREGGRPEVREGQLALFGAGEHVTLAAAEAQDDRAATMDVLLLGGLPIGEPVAWAGPFVMNTRGEVMQAFDDYRRGRLGVVPADADVAKGH